MHQYEPQIRECVARRVFPDQRRARQAGRQTCASNGNMRRLPDSYRILLALLLFSALVSAGTPGSFRGSIVDGPGEGRDRIYVQGRNGLARRVDISRARVSYDEGVPAATRRPRPDDALTAGAEVRVTAEQGCDGEWKASRVEILKAAASEERRAEK